MSANFVTEAHDGRPGSAVRARFVALRQAYLVHTLKRAITDVMATEERDYRDFGLDKRDVLAGLSHLLDTVRTSCASVGTNESAFKVALAMQA